MVFEPTGAPRDHATFLRWYHSQTKWDADEIYDDPDRSSPRLQAWLAEMFCIYPPMNGPGAADELPEDESSLADYSIGEQIAHVCFAWSRASGAYDDVFRLAEKYGLGFFNVSSDSSELWFPEGGGLKLVGQEKPILNRWLRRFLDAFRP